MSRGTAWILSDDMQFTEELRQGLGHQTGVHVAGLSMSAWVGGQQPRGRPQWLFLDLRPESAWERVSQIRGRYEVLNGEAVPVIGIVEDGYPWEQAGVANEALTTTICWPFAHDRLPGLLRDAVAMAHAEGPWRSEDHRILESASVRFRTQTPSLFPMMDDLAVATRHDVTVLLVGETGTGKTTLARLIHELSSRRHRRFLTVGCGTLSNELIESELFGHVRGAFTGADCAKDGKFAAAGDGTILLDEIDVLTLRQQARLLRVIETGEFEPVGSNETRLSRARIIVASNRSLESLMAEKRFRDDLYFRLSELKLEVPPLRNRPLDVVPLALEFIQECCREESIPLRRIHPEFFAVLKSYHWPGNIRELRNAVRNAVLFSRDGTLTPQLLPPGVVLAGARRVLNEHEESAASGLAGEVAQTERLHIEHMLRVNNFNRAATARALRISRVTLYNKMRKYSIRVNHES